MRKIYVHSLNPLFTAQPVRELFARWTQLPVTVENRSRSAAFSEVFGGTADQQKNFILCSLGKCIGAAFGRPSDQSSSMMDRQIPAKKDKPNDRTFPEYGQ